MTLFAGLCNVHLLPESFPAILFFFSSEWETVYLNIIFAGVVKFLLTVITFGMKVQFGLWW